MGLKELTEKRFTLTNPKNAFQEMKCGINDRDKTLTFNEVIDLLNDQSELIQELYDFRLLYNALLFNEWFKNDVCEVYKSMKHHDGEPCFDGEWFIVVAILPTGKQITNHYNIQDWDLFQIPEYPQVKDTFDGHTSKDVLKRLREIRVKGLIKNSY